MSERRLRLYIPAVLSGTALVFAFPSFDLYPIAWVALVPFLVSLSRMDTWRSFKAGFLFGLPFFCGTLYWVYHSMHYYGGVSLVTSVFLVFLMCSYLGLYPALFAALFSAKVRSTTLPALLLAPVLWVSIEFLRSYALTGFPWSSLGYSQYKFAYLIQIADITSVYGVSFLVMLVNGAIADVFISMDRRNRMPLFPLTATVAGYFLLPAIAVAVSVYGYVQLNAAPAGREIRASLVQGKIEQDVKWDPRFQAQVFDIYTGLTARAVQDFPSIIIWPETAVPFYFGTDRTYTDALVDFQKTLGTPLLFGSITVKENSGNADAEAKKGAKRQYANSAVLLDTSGNTAYVYDKIHLVPFGEYVPLRRLLFFVDKMTVGVGDYTRGTEYSTAKISAGRFATLICYEVIFPGQTRKYYRSGGDFMVTITNDAWFGRTNGPYQHWSMGVFRAVENRKPLLRAANSGISGIIDSKGRVVANTHLFERTVLTGDVMTDSRKTFYTKYGDLFSYFCILLSVILLFKSRRF